MPERIFGYLFVAGWVAAELIRAPFRWRNSRNRLRGAMADQRIDAGEAALMTLGAAGMQGLPTYAALSDRLACADWRLPKQTSRLLGALGIMVSEAALWLLWRSHKDLGQNWSPTLEVKEEHALVTGGVYGRVRHPIYAAQWLMGLGQCLLLQNWIAGLAGLAAFLPIYLYRVPREERMMLDHFGDEYRAYMARTGRVIPRWGKQPGA